MYRDDVAALTARREALEHEVADKTRELDEMTRLLDEARGIRRLPVLPDTRRAASCSASWDDMQGDDRVRSCDRCKQQVFNLTAMTADEAEALIFERAGELCVRFFRRRDGTILTADCWVGRQRQRRWKLAAAAVATSLAAVLAADHVITDLEAIHDREVHAQDDLGLNLNEDTKGGFRHVIEEPADEDAAVLEIDDPLQINR